MKTHGMSKTKVYAVWCGMLARCNNKNHPQYKHWGGRGIKVCNKWHVFENFYEDMGEPDGLTLDRIDNDGNYEPDNCRWATHKEQGRNSRNVKPITYAGQTLSVREWADVYEMSEDLLRSRLSRGLPMREALQLGRKRKPFWSGDSKEFLKAQILADYNFNRKFYHEWKYSRNT